MNDDRTKKYAGFWKRAIALWIDAIIVSFVIFPLAILIALFCKDIIVIEPPFNMFTKRFFKANDVCKIHYIKARSRKKACKFCMNRGDELQHFYTNVAFENIGFRAFL